MNGDPVATYELVNWQVTQNGVMEFVTVGRYDASQPKGHEFSMNRNITWMEGQTQVGLDASNEVSHFLYTISVFINLKSVFQYVFV